MKTLPLIRGRGVSYGGGQSSLSYLFGGGGGDEPAAAPAKPAAAESATPKSDEDPKVKVKEGEQPAADKAAAGKSKPAASAADKASPQRFVPSEQVRADFDVSFPIDI